MLSFMNFLKKYSNVPNQFIDDFFSLMDYRDFESNEKIVDLDKIVKWLDINKAMAKKTLMKSYRKNIDYVIKKVIKPKKSARKIFINIEYGLFILNNTFQKKTRGIIPHNSIRPSYRI